MGTGTATSPTTDEFDEGLRTLGVGSRYREGSPGAFRCLYATVELAARQMRDQLVGEVGASKRVPEILAGVNDSSAFNAFAAQLSGRRYMIAVNYGTLILIHDLVHRLFECRDQSLLFGAAASLEFGEHEVVLQVGSAEVETHSLAEMLHLLILAEHVGVNFVQSLVTRHLDQAAVEFHA